jgi:hypothetical protein
MFLSLRILHDVALAMHSRRFSSGSWNIFVPIQGLSVKSSTATNMRDVFNYTLYRDV